MANVLGAAAVRQMKFAYRHSRKRQPAERTAPFPRVLIQQLIEGVTISALARAENALDGESGCWCQRLVRRDNGQLELSGGATTTNDDDYFWLTSRSKDLALDRLTYVVCSVVNGEFRWLTGDCNAGEFTVGPGPNGQGGGAAATGTGTTSPFGAGSFGSGSFGD